MTLRQQLCHMISGRGLDEDELEWVISQVIAEAEKTDLELCWDTEIKELPDLHDEQGQLSDKVMRYLWMSAGKVVSEQVIYLRTRAMAELIQQFDQEHPYRRTYTSLLRTWGSRG